MALPSPGQIKSAVMLASLAIGGYLVWRASQKVGEAIDTAEEIITTDLNPASSDNIVYTNTPDVVKDGFNSFFGALDSVGLLPK